MVGSVSEEALRDDTGRVGASDGGRIYLLLFLRRINGVCLELLAFDIVVNLQFRVNAGRDSYMTVFLSSA
jgi:hypothetical protein